MSIQLCPGENLFESDAKALVNPVNCVGTMGKGLALLFKRKYPENHHAYLRQCSHPGMTPGTVFPFVEKENFIINFPTKLHWRDPSRMEYIHSGLVSLRDCLLEHEIPSVAVPALGCGLGGLAWEKVLPRIEHILGQEPKLQNLKILVYPPR